MDCVSLIVSICALIISAISFIRYDKKIKEQNLAINQYKMQQIEESKRMNNSAKVSGAIIKGNRDMRTLVISNTGLAPARNVNVTDIRKFKGVLQTGGLVFPYSLLNPGEKIEIPFMISLSSPDTIDVKCRWDDENKQNNIYQQTLQL